MIGIFDIPANYSGKVANINNLGKKIRAARLARSTTEDQMAEFLKITVEQYKSFERDAVSDIDTSMLEKIMKLLLCSWSFIISNDYYLCGNRTDAITKSDIEISVITIPLIRERIDNMVKENGITTMDLRRALPIDARETIEGTYDIEKLKLLAERLNCCWQYLAGLSASKFTTDILFEDYTDDKYLSAINDFFSNTIVQFKCITKYTKESAETTTDEKQIIKFFNKIAGLRIRHIREMRGLSQDEMAAHLGISRQMIGKIESGIANIVKKDNITLKQIDSVLRCSEEYILSLSDKPTGSGIYNYNFCELENFVTEYIVKDDHLHFKEIYKPENVDLRKLFYEVSQLSQENRSIIIEIINKSLALIRRNSK